jgi:hypothetical protein
MKNFNERRSTQRRKFIFHMPVFDDETDELFGHLTDISDLGIRLDCLHSQPLEKDFNLRVELTSEVADKPFMSLVARSKWCREDKLMPNTYNVGFQIMHLEPGDVAIFNRLSEKYAQG